MKKERLLEIGRMLENNGFICHYPKTTSGFWIYAEDPETGGLAYIQNDDFGGLSVSTVHKANSETGTGFLEHVPGITPEMVRETCNTFAPEWVSHKDRETVEKFKGWSDYISNPINALIVYTTNRQEVTE